eukprot:Gb_30277 [translate_table: standard]
MWTDWYSHLQREYLRNDFELAQSFFFKVVGHRKGYSFGSRIPENDAVKNLENGADFGCEFYWGVLELKEYYSFDSRIAKNGASALNTFPWARPMSHILSSLVGTDFGMGSIRLDEIELYQVSKFTKIWSCRGGNGNKGVTFYKPVEIPFGYFTLGHYGQPNSEPLHGWVLVVKDNKISLDAQTTQLLSTQQSEKPILAGRHLPALERPVNYTLVWSSESWKGKQDGIANFWLPTPPDGYSSVGFVVTNTPEKPSLEEVRCVRSDLTDNCETTGLIWSTESSNLSASFSVWNMRPKARGMQAQGICIGTFYCIDSLNSKESIPVACLKNVNFSLSAMPNLTQAHEIIRIYGPTVFFHPDEIYFPSSVFWYFENGILLRKKGEATAEAIAVNGSNLPQGGSNDGEYWLDLPEDDNTATKIKHGDLQSAEAYVHIKPMLGGTFTDIVMWIFYPFNGPGTAKIRSVNLPLGKIGQHVGDWEHFTLRVSNFTGKLWRLYFSQHSGGKWVNASDLEYIEGNKAVVYASKSGHASFPHAGLFLQGNSKVGIRNDSARSKYFLDTSIYYKIVAAEYLQSLGDNETLSEPPWLNYAREWGPKTTYDSRAEINELGKFLPTKLGSSLEHLFKVLPKEVSGEEGPTGPKMKNSWNGDERGSRQADLIITADTVTMKMAPSLVRSSEQMSEPRYVIAMGVCTITGGSL